MDQLNDIVLVCFQILWMSIIILTILFDLRVRFTNLGAFNIGNLNELL